LHELSIAQRLVSLAESAIHSDAASQSRSTRRVSEVHLRIGALSGVETDALLFCYGIATAETALEGSRLVIEEVPISIYCPACASEFDLPGIQSFRCPRCDRPSGDIRQGRELDLTSIQFEATAE
jgi:hydrogenase nickel incorporation protein HypA/HybF